MDAEQRARCAMPGCGESGAFRILPVGAEPPTLFVCDAHWATVERGFYCEAARCTVRGAGRLFWVVDQAHPDGSLFLCADHLYAAGVSGGR